MVIRSEGDECQGLRLMRAVPAADAGMWPGGVLDVAEQKVNTGVCRSHLRLRSRCYRFTRSP